MFKKTHNYEKEIMDLLFDRRMYIKEIAEELHTSRNTIDKYLGILIAKNQVEYEQIGILKLCWAKK